MLVQRIAMSAAFAAGLAALPVATAQAQYAYPCNPFPLYWPFCAAAVVVGTAGAIVSAPFRGAIAPYYPYYPYYTAPAPYAPPAGAYYPAGTNGSPYAYYGPR
jgi:hypothetical protein